MVQIPPNIIVSNRDAKGKEAAAYLENTVNELAQEGWEFYRVDSIGEVERPGCFSSGQQKTSIYYVVTFRKEI